MDDQQRIKINVADRVYPLTVPREEEERLRNAARRIEEMLRDFEEKYAVQDKQDLLAMCALQFAARLEKNRGKSLIDADGLEEQLNAMVNKIDGTLAS